MDLHILLMPANAKWSKLYLGIYKCSMSYESNYSSNLSWNSVP